MFGERGVASCDKGPALKPRNGSSVQAPATACVQRGFVPLAEVSVQDMLPRRRQVFGERGVALCGECQLPSRQRPFTRAPTKVFGKGGVASSDGCQLPSRPRALQPKRRQRHVQRVLVHVCKTRCCAVNRFLASAVSHHTMWASFQAAQGLFSASAGNGMCSESWFTPRRIDHTRHAAAPSTDVWRARCRFARRGLAFKPPKVSSVRAPATACVQRGLVSLAAVSVQGTLPRRP